MAHRWNTPRHHTNPNLLDHPLANLIGDLGGFGDLGGLGSLGGLGGHRHTPHHNSHHSHHTFPRTTGGGGFGFGSTGSEHCIHGERCIKFGCIKVHPPARRTECSFGDACHKASCMFLHPLNRSGLTRPAQRLLVPVGDPVARSPTASTASAPCRPCGATMAGGQKFCGSCGWRAAKDPTAALVDDLVVFIAARTPAELLAIHATQFYVDHPQHKQHMLYSKLKLKQLAAAYPSQLRWVDGADAGKHRIVLAITTTTTTGAGTRSSTGHATTRAPLHPRGAATPPATPPRTRWVPASSATAGGVASRSWQAKRVLCKWEKDAHAVDGCWARNRGGDCPYAHHDQPDLLKMISADMDNPDRIDAAVMWKTATAKIAPAATTTTTTVPAAPVVGPLLRKGSAVWYTNQDGSEDKATIKAVHVDDRNDPYYTIRLRNDASEKNTTASRVRVRISSTTGTPGTPGIPAAAAMPDAPPKIVPTAPVRPVGPGGGGGTVGQPTAGKTAVDDSTCRFCSTKKMAATWRTCTNGHPFCRGCFSGLVAGVAEKQIDELLELDLMAPGSKSWVMCPVAGCPCSFSEQLIARSVPESIYDVYAITKEAVRDERCHREIEAQKRAEREADREAKRSKARVADKARAASASFAAAASAPGESPPPYCG